MTTWSSVVHSDSQRGSPAALATSRLPSSELPGMSCWHATGQASGTKACAAAASEVPWNGAPSVMIRRALAIPSSRRAQIEGHHAACRVTDHIDRRSAVCQCVVDGGVKHGSVGEQAAGAGAGQGEDGCRPAGGADAAGQRRRALRCCRRSQELAAPARAGSAAGRVCLAAWPEPGPAWPPRDAADGNAGDGGQDDGRDGDPEDAATTGQTGKPRPAPPASPPVDWPAHEFHRTGRIPAHPLRAGHGDDPPGGRRAGHGPHAGTRIP